jgi:4-diphosphocytidyl-2-C-methyl-D-erythritol kinase
MQALILKSYAKINLLLNITGQRNDGYHTLDGVMIPVSLHDTVRVAKAKDLRVACDDTRIAQGEQNSAWKTAACFFDYTGLPYGADIYIQKRIPCEAGLGGGSSDAACVLLALNRLYFTQLNLNTLIKIASRCGADIPFFLSGGAKRAQGIGERLQPVRYHFKYPFVLVKPQGGVNTAEAYRIFQETTAEKADVPACIRALEKNDIASFIEASKNMLQKAGTALCPAIKDAVFALYQAGALYAQMTGSGSAVYGIFEDDAQAKTAAKSISETGLYEFAFPTAYSPHTCETVLTIYEG